MPVKFCLGCRKLTKNGSYCETCEAANKHARDAARPSTTQRGLGWRHQRKATQVTADVEVCPRCGQPPTKDNPITAHHTVARAKGGADSPLVPLCRRCNSQIGDRTQHPDT